MSSTVGQVDNVYRAYELQARDGFDSLNQVERRSRTLAADEVRVRVRAVSLNYRDLLIARGAKHFPKPSIPISDGAGEVIEVGASVTRLRVGDRVAANFFPTWIDGPLSDAHHTAALGAAADGMLAEEVVLHEAAWVQLPAHLSFDEGATLPCAGLTAWHALFEATHTKPGDTVVIQGTGGVSLFALQLARAAGANVIATSSSESKRARVRALGASEVIDYSTVTNWGQRVRELTNGNGADTVIEVGGAGTFDQSVTALRYSGTLSLIGVLTGVTGNVSTLAILQRLIRVVGIYVGSRRMFEAFNAALSASNIHPVIDTTFDFADARSAYEHLASARHFGKVVIRLP